MTAREDDAKNELADILMQRMAEHAPVVQKCNVHRSGMRWSVLWGEHIGGEADTRFEAVMLIVQNLYAGANADHDPRTDEADPGELEEGTLNADELDPKTDSDNDTP